MLAGRTRNAHPFLCSVLLATQELLVPFALSISIPPWNSLTVFFCEKITFFCEKIGVLLRENPVLLRESRRSSERKSAFFREKIAFFYEKVLYSFD